jgi:AcrR family transcriptional regulator
MAPDDPPPGAGQARARRPGGRSARVREAVLSATLALMEEKGIQGLTVAEIAARAGVHETSIYRRWGQPAQLVTEACLTYADRQMPVPDTGSLFGDLVAMHAEGVRFLESPMGHGMVAWSVQAPNTPPFNEVVASYWRGRAAQHARIFERARARGEWTSDEDISLLLTRLIGPMYFRHFLLRLKTGPDDIAEMIRRFLASCGDRPDAAG